MAAKLDRLTRSLLDFAELVKDAQKHGYDLVVVDQSLQPRHTPRTRDGRDAELSFRNSSAS